MIIFLDEDRAYLYWVAHHRAGYVLDTFRKPTKSRLMLHRATCPEIKTSPNRRTHWTTGRHLKACALDAEQLKAWAVEQAQVEPKLCPNCLAQGSDTPQPLHLSHLDKEVLSFVLEVATLHLDDRDTSYLLTVGKAAKCLTKTPGQLAVTLERLAEQGLVTIAGNIRTGEQLPTHCHLLPTVAAMRTLPAFQSLSDAEIEAELAALDTDGIK